MKRPNLTERQQEVLALLVKGNTMREVGTILKITPRTAATALSEQPVRELSR